MAKRWFWQIVAALLLLSIPAGATWRAQGPEEGLQPMGEAAVAEGAPDEGCAKLAELKPVDLVVRLADGRTAQVGSGYREPEQEERILAPVRGVIPPFAPGPWGLTWDATRRTAAMLREGEVLSIHIPEGRGWAGAAVLNGEVVGAEAVLCEDRLYVSLRLLADGLGLRYRWRDAHSILVESR